MQYLSPGARDTIAAIQMNISKLGFKTKMRLLYLAPKDKFRKEVKMSIVGGFSQFNDTNLNAFKTDSRRTGTVVPFKLSKTLEDPYIRYKANRRKRKFIRFFKQRSFKKGSPAFVLSTEELATVFHFPLLTVKAPAITKAEARKAEPPINLPIQY